MKAYLIDPFTNLIMRIDYHGDIEEINQLIGCRIFTVAEFAENGDCVFVDDEGLLKVHRLARSR